MRVAKKIPNKEYHFICGCVISDKEVINEIRRLSCSKGKMLCPKHNEGIAYIRYECVACGTWFEGHARTSALKYCADCFPKFSVGNKRKHGFYDVSDLKNKNTCGCLVSSDFLDVPKFKKVADKLGYETISDFIYCEYTDTGISIREIAKMAGTTYATIREKLLKLGAQMKAIGGNHKKPAAPKTNVITPRRCSKPGCNAFVPPENRFLCRDCYKENSNPDSYDQAYNYF